jgi:hypothetical protein
MNIPYRQIVLLASTLLSALLLVLPGCEDKKEPTNPAPTDTSAAADAETDAADDTAVGPKWPYGVEAKTGWAIGIARVDVSPVSPVHLGGYGLCAINGDECRIQLGIHDPATATAFAAADLTNGALVVIVAVDSVGLVATDLSLWRSEIATLLQAQGAPIDATRIILTSSHSHCTPDTLGLWSPIGGRDPAYAEQVRAGIVRAALDATAAIRPANLVYGQGELAQWSNDKDATDYQLQTLQAREPETGKVIASLVRWGGHPTVYSQNNLAISADYVGVTRALIEAKTGALSIFVQGSLAAIYPEETATCETKDPFPNGYMHADVTELQHRLVICTGTTVADVAIKALAEATVPIGTTGIKTRDVKYKIPLENEQLRLAANLGLVPLPESLDLSVDQVQWESRLSWIQLGDIDLLTIPGEASPAFTEALLKRMQAAGRTRVMAIGMSQDWMGYLLTPAQWQDDDFAYQQTVSIGPQVLAKTLAALELALDPTAVLP